MSAARGQSFCSSATRIQVQVFRSILAWCDEHEAATEFPAMFEAVRSHQLETFECRSLLVHLPYIVSAYKHDSNEHPQR